MRGPMQPGRGQPADVVTGTEVPHHRVDQFDPRRRPPGAELGRHRHLQPAYRHDPLATPGRGMQTLPHLPLRNPESIRKLRSGH